VERLSARDFRLVGDFIADVYRLDDVDAFRRHSAAALTKLIPSDMTSYNEMNPRLGVSVNWLDPPEIDTPVRAQVWQDHMHEHPILRHYLQTKTGHACRISDFISQRQFRESTLYNELYRGFDVRYQLATHLPTLPPLVIALALHRGRHDFSERERLILNVLRPHLERAYHNAQTVNQIRRDVRSLTEALEESKWGVVTLTERGRIRLVTPQAGRWLKEYFGWQAQRRELPLDLQRWATAQNSKMDRRCDLTRRPAPLVVPREGRELRVRLLANAGRCTLLFEERYGARSPEAFCRPAGPRSQCSRNRCPRLGD